MIIVKLNGGLGNQLFQYAAAYSLALKNKDYLKIDISGYSNSIIEKQIYRNFDLADFLISAEVASVEEVERAKNPLKLFSKFHRLIRQKVFKLYFVDWHPKILLKTGNIFLDGYFQSEKYFIDCVDNLMQELVLKPDLYSQIESLVETIISSPVSVSLHIRRGDYVENPKTSQHHLVCDIPYYVRAIELMRNKFPNLHLYIFSDDPDWVRSNLPLAVPATFVSKGKGIANSLRPSQEIVLMSKCHHHILSNSSFSWWGAYLNRSGKKVVLAPNVWNKGPIKQPNILPNGWISFPVELK